MWACLVGVDVVDLALKPNFCSDASFFALPWNRLGCIFSVAARRPFAVVGVVVEGESVVVPAVRESNVALIPCSGVSSRSSSVDSFAGDSRRELCGYTSNNKRSPYMTVLERLQRGHYSLWDFVVCATTDAVAMPCLTQLKAFRSQRDCEKCTTKTLVVNITLVYGYDVV